jgi:CBS domain-containing protein
MQLADVLDICTMKAVTVSPDVSLAEAVRAMHRDDAAVIHIEGRLQGVLTPGDILRFLTLAASPILAWNGPVMAALGDDVEIIPAEEPIHQVIEKMSAAGINHLQVATTTGVAVVSLCRLLLVENAYLHGEVQHLQTYIDALHDAPND